MRANIEVRESHAMVECVKRVRWHEGRQADARVIESWLRNSPCALCEQEGEWR